MPTRLLVALVAAASLVAGCSVDSPKLRSGPPVTTGPAIPTTTVTTVAGAATTIALPGTQASPSVSVAPAGASCPTAAAAPVGAITTVATAKSGLGSVAVYASPGAASACATLTNPDTEFTRSPIFVALQQQPGWTQVELPTRPNGSVGWVRAGDVTTAQHRYRIEISISGHRVKVFRGAEQVVDTAAAVGTGDTPTPPGTYYTVALIKPTNGGYGPYAYALSGHSDTLFTFAGGDGRIGLHGTDDPGSIGKDVSHGCIRVPNDVITRMAEDIGLPLGVPVVITA